MRISLAVAAAMSASVLVLAGCSSEASDGADAAAAPTGEASPASSADPTPSGDAAPSESVAPLPEDWANESTAPRPAGAPSSPASASADVPDEVAASVAAAANDEPIDVSEMDIEQQEDVPAAPSSAGTQPPGQANNSLATWPPIFITPPMAGQTIPLYVGQTATLSGFPEPNTQYKLTLVAEPADHVTIQQAEGSNAATITGAKGGSTVVTVYDNDPKVNQAAASLMTFTFAVADLSTVPTPSPAAAAPTGAPVTRN